MATSCETAHGDKFSCEWDKPEEICTLEATVVTGFETIAKDECREKLNVLSRIERGRIFFELPVTRASEALKLCSVDNVYVLIKEIKSFEFPKEKEVAFEKLKLLIYNLNWATGLLVWKQISNYQELTLEEILHHGCKVSESGEESEGMAAKSDSTAPRFRVTCHRSGKNHCFTSMEAAAEFGGAINDEFRWKVDMKNHNIEVVLNIDENSLYVCIALTKESLHRRNLEYFGPTSLRATIAYSLLRLSSIKPQDIVCDPMCGGGSIPIEAALNWRNCYFLCGDNHPLAWLRTLQNVTAVNKKLGDEASIAVDIFQWDACALPLKNNSVDVIVTDLPFGKRMGSKVDNRKLYPNFLMEMARICKVNSGRAVLLTQDKTTMSKVVMKCSRFWRQARVIGVNIGGLAACAYLLLRTSLPVQSCRSTQPASQDE